MRDPWLARWQDVICLVVAGAIGGLLITLDLVGDDGGIYTAPYAAVFAFAFTWVTTDFAIAWLITQRERQREPASPKPTPTTRVALPRAIARPRAR
jgi:hypothetical protein